MTERLNLLTILRPARPEDFDYCARLYFEGMEKVIKQLNQTMEAQLSGFRQRWDVTQVKIIMLDGAYIGWLQSFVKKDALFLAQLFVDRALRGQGIGTAMVIALIEEASRADRALTLGVVRTNPALRFSTNASGFAPPMRTSASSTCGATRECLSEIPHHFSNVREGSTVSRAGTRR
jgi:GNAT superfamily N-acetyltransferase